MKSPPRHARMLVAFLGTARSAFIGSAAAPPTHLPASRAVSQFHHLAAGGPASFARQRRGALRLRMVAAQPEAEAATAAGRSYDPATVEPKWQNRWEAENTFVARRREGKEKKYVLDMFPYPSGAGLHVGHPEGYTASDIMARYWRMRDYDVLHPMGWDAFGLPAEQHAINTGTHPEATTKTNIANFKRQLRSLGFSYDWGRELATTDIGYVKWTQWIFLQLFKRDLAFQSEVRVNWCAGLGTVLSNEEVIDGKSERGDFPVVRRPLRQWVLRITAYAERLAADLATEGLEWPQGTMTMQRSWIGRSEGAEIAFDVESAPDGADASLRVFTTRPDTLLGATYVVIAPEHPLATAQRESSEAGELSEYIDAAARRSELDRTSAKTKTGVFSGMYATHPLTGEPLPVWVADYVLAGYGTGAVMAVPAHDERDFEFAKQFELPIKQVVAASAGAPADGSALEEALTAPGVCVNSGDGLDGLKTDAAKAAVIERLEAAGKGEKKISFKLRDWVFSRQRYWGEPIPIYFPVTMDEPGGDPRKGDAHTINYDEAIPVDEADLPVELPELDDFQPGDDPSGCLARVLDWRFFQKEEGGPWFARETNTMPQWAGSCWYYLRFADPLNENAAWSPAAEKSWLPVDLYVGGAEHAVLHLLYARFWHKVLYDLNLVTTLEPFQKLVHQGMILGEDGEKMSKSRGNVINPDVIVEKYGGDAMRLYEMFMGPLEAVKPWQTEQISGVVRFQQRVYSLAQKHVDLGDAGADVEMSEETTRLMHQTVQKVTNDVDTLSFNTAISQMMIFSTHLASLPAVPREPLHKLTLLLAPFAPHLAEEMWEIFGNTETLTYEPWPTFDAALAEDKTVKLGVQVNGKARGEIELPKDADEAMAKELALNDERVAKFVADNSIKKFIYVPGRIVNIVLGGGPAKKKEEAPAAASDTAPFELLDVRVGRIVEAWPHPDSDKLWCEKIDVGEDEPREIASGLRAYYKSADELVDRKVLVVCNLKAAKLAGFASNGMVLCASSEDRETVAFVEPPAAAEPGMRVLMEGQDAVEPASGNAMKKKKWMEKAAEELKAVESVATAHGKPLIVAGEKCVSPSVASGSIN